MRKRRWSPRASGGNRVSPQAPNEHRETLQDSQAFARQYTVRRAESSVHRAHLVAVALYFLAAACIIFAVIDLGTDPVRAAFVLCAAVVLWVLGEAVES